MTEKPTRSTNTMRNHLPNNAYSTPAAVDYRTIGLSPQYWTHTPLLIGDVVGLPLINGVDCFICSSCASSRDDEQRPPNIILPLSKVILQGIITAIDRRPNGCILLVLDDGTGSIDVRYWDNDDSNNGWHHDLEGPQQRQKKPLSIGDYCEVLGKIKTMTAGTKYSCNCLGNDVRFGCTREIHASSVCTMNRKHSTNTNGEILHWVKCLNFTRDVQDNKVKSGQQMLPLLGDSITQSIMNSESVECFESESSSNNFIERKCCQTPQLFRKAMLYCHCEATLETLDPSFTYRDALLQHLLDMEAELRHLSQCSHDTTLSSTEDCIDLIGGEVNGSNHVAPPLLFTFESMYKDEQLASIAREVVADTLVPEVNARQLTQNTFRAMVNDGLLSLFDPSADLYLLLSIGRVMEPYFSYSLSKAYSVAPPFFIRHVPRKRINRIKNWVSED